MSTVYPLGTPSDWRGIHGKPYIIVSSKGLSNGLSDIPNDSADFGPDTMLGATSPGQYGPPYSQTLGIAEAINYAPQGTTVVIKGGLYNLTAPVTITNKQWIKILGENKPLINDAVGKLSGLFVFGDQIADVTVDGIIFNAQSTTTGAIVFAGTQTWANFNGNTGITIYLHNIGIYGGNMGGLVINPSSSSSVAWQGVTLDKVYDNSLYNSLYGITLPGYNVGNTSVWAYMNGGDILRISNSSLNRGIYQHGYYLYVINSLINGLVGDSTSLVVLKNMYMYLPNTSYLQNMMSGSSGIISPVYINSGTIDVDGAFLDLSNIPSGIGKVAAMGANFGIPKVIRGKNLMLNISSSATAAGLVFTQYIAGTTIPAVIDLEDIFIQYTGSTTVPTYDWVNFPGATSLPPIDFRLKGVEFGYPIGGILQRVFVPNMSTPAVPATGTAQKNTNPFTVEVALYGGVVSEIQITRNGTTYTVLSLSTAGALGGQSYRLDPGDSITITYTTAPTWVWLPA